MGHRVGRIEVVEQVQAPAVPDVVEHVAHVLLQRLLGQVQLLGRHLAIHAGRDRQHEDLALRTLGQVLSHHMGVQAQLANHGAVVAHQPLGMDLVVEADAVGHRADHHRAVGGRAIGAGPAIGHPREAQVRGVEALLVVARPGDIEEMALAVGVGVHHRGGGGDHLLDGAGHAGLSVDRADMVIIVVDLADGAIDPDAMGDAVDVIDDVDKLVVEASQALRARRPRVLHRHAVAMAHVTDFRPIGHDERQARADSREGLGLRNARDGGLGARGRGL